MGLQNFAVRVCYLSDLRLPVIGIGDRRLIRLGHLAQSSLVIVRIREGHSKIGSNTRDKQARIGLVVEIQVLRSGASYCSKSIRAVVRHLGGVTVAIDYRRKEASSEVELPLFPILKCQKQTCGGLRQRGRNIRGRNRNEDSSALQTKGPIATVAPRVLQIVIAAQKNSLFVRRSPIGPKNTNRRRQLFLWP